MPQGGDRIAVAAHHVEREARLDLLQRLQGRQGARLVTAMVSQRRQEAQRRTVFEGELLSGVEPIFRLGKAAQAGQSNAHAQVPGGGVQDRQRLV